MPILSIVIPTFNEEKNIRWFFDKLTPNLLGGKNYELIYIDDGSQDNTLAEIKKLPTNNRIRVRYISFSRNFGKESATTAGIEKATGEVVLLIDADGQHPPELIPNFISKWREGYDVVVGVRKSNKKEGFIKKAGSVVFYKMLGMVGQKKIVPGSTDYRLIDRKVVEEYRKLTERSRVTRGLIDWLGFKRAYIHFDANERTHGKAAYSLRKLLRLALNGIVSQSTKPLLFSGFIGGLVTFFSGLIGLAIIVNSILGDPHHLKISGAASLGVMTSFLVGVVLACQGLLAIYIENIYRESQNRPLYIIDVESD